MYVLMFKLIYIFLNLNVSGLIYEQMFQLVQYQSSKFKVYWQNQQKSCFWPLTNTNE